jgi:hypothetical protein
MRSTSIPFSPARQWKWEGFVWKAPHKKLNSSLVFCTSAHKAMRKDLNWLHQQNEPFCYERASITNFTFSMSSKTLKASYNLSFFFASSAAQSLIVKTTKRSLSMIKNQNRSKRMLQKVPGRRFGRTFSFRFQALGRRSVTQSLLNIPATNLCLKIITVERSWRT